MSSIAYDEILDFITSAPSLDEIKNFQHSPETLERVKYLVQADKEDTLTDSEHDELKEFTKANELMAQLKLRAKRRLE
jgi:hypothetical protein